MDLRVDDHEDPCAELERLLDLNEWYLTPPDEDDRVPLDDDLRAELEEFARAEGQETLRGLGRAPRTSRCGSATTGSTSRSSTSRAASR